MTDEDLFRDAFASLEVSEDFTQADLLLRDGSTLRFRHAVGERWAKADGSGLADQLLPLVGLFRLNRRHLDVRFHDGTRWEARFRGD